MERKKKKVTKQSKEKKQTKLTAVESTYFKLCHFCFHLNEGDQPIMDCTQCANLLSSEPIEEFYEDVYQSAGASNPSHDEDEEEPTQGAIPSPELRGLSVIW